MVLNIIQGDSGRITNVEVFHNSGIHQYAIDVGASGIVGNVRDFEIHWIKVDTGDLNDPTWIARNNLENFISIATIAGNKKKIQLTIPQDVRYYVFAFTSQRTVVGQRVPFYNTYLFEASLNGENLEANWTVVFLGETPHNDSSRINAIITGHAATYYQQNSQVNERDVIIVDRGEEVSKPVNTDAYFAKFPGRNFNNPFASIILPDESLNFGGIYLIFGSLNNVATGSVNVFVKEVTAENKDSVFFNNLQNWVGDRYLALSVIYPDGNRIIKGLFKYTWNQTTVQGLTYPYENVKYPFEIINVPDAVYNGIKSGIPEIDAGRTV